MDGHPPSNSWQRSRARSALAAARVPSRRPGKRDGDRTATTGRVSFATCGATKAPADRASTEREKAMHRRQLIMLTIAGTLAGFASHAARAEEHNDPALIKAMDDAKVTLQQGLAAAAEKGRPISAKFELEDGKLQLSVYTAKDGKFSEVIVDHTTGTIAKTESITEGEDLAEAKSQNAAMEKAKTDLKAAVDKAAAATSGSRAISIIPVVKDGHIVAAVTLLLGQQAKTVDQPL